MHLFIDANAYLSFYHFSGDDLEELKKLAVLLHQGELTLVVPQQTRHEFERNRESKIADALKRLREQTLKLQYPQLCSEYDDYRTLRRLQREYDEVHSRLLAQLATDVGGATLKADLVIDELFRLATLVPTDDHLLRRARLRVEIGNPPGKNGSLGDALNWEAILAVVPKGTDVCFVTADSDYFSPLDSDAFHPFLLKWSCPVSVDG